MIKKILILIAFLAIVGGLYFSPILNQAPSEEPGSTSKTYSSEKLGITFNYSSRYFLKEHDESSGLRNRYALVLAEDTEENRRVFSGQEPGRDGPPTITISVFQNNLDHYTTERWVTGTNDSNFKLATGATSTITVGGEPGLAYTATGLYENKNVVVTRPNFVYMFTVSYLTPTDQIIKDFDTLLRTVRFQNSPAAEIASLSNIIVVDSPKEGEAISSPLKIKGKARGTWFFEANFPIALTNWDGLIIAEHYAEAKSEWMTEEFVPFEATLTFKKPEFGERGTLILKKSNASGLPEHDAALEIPVIFK